MPAGTLALPARGLVMRALTLAPADIVEQAAAFEKEALAVLEAVQPGQAIEEPQRQSRFCRAYALARNSFKQYQESSAFC